MTSPTKLGAVALPLVFTSPALAHFTKPDKTKPDKTALTKLDDFQRAPGTNMGPHWQVNHVGFSIIATDQTNHVAQALNYAEMNFTGKLKHHLSPTTDWFGITAIDSHNQTPQFAGLVLRWADPAHSVLVKLQDDNGDGSFDSISFNQGTSAPVPLVSDGSFDQAITLPGAGDEVAMRARVGDDPANPNTLEVVVQLDTNHNGIWGEPADEEFVRGHVAKSTVGNGKQVGLAGTGGVMMDDFDGHHYTPEPGTLSVPEPAPLASLLVGVLVAASPRFRTRSGGSPSSRPLPERAA